MLDINNIILTNVRACYPDNVYVYLNDIPIKTCYANNKPYRTIVHGCIYDITSKPYAIMTYNYKFYSSHANFIHSCIIRQYRTDFKDIIIDRHIRQINEIHHQGRVFIVNITEQQGSIVNKYSIFLLSLWQDDYEPWIKSHLLERYPGCDRYFLIVGHNHKAKLYDMLNYNYSSGHHIYHPLDNISIPLAKYHFYRYIGD